MFESQREGARRGLKHGVYAFAWGVEESNGKHGAWSWLNVIRYQLLQHLQYMISLSLAFVTELS